MSTDDVAGAGAIAHEHGMWLHVEGDALALLVLTEARHTPPLSGVLRHADSMSVDMPAAFALGAGDVWCTLARGGAAPATPGAPPADFIEQLQPPLLTLPLWIVIQHVGIDSIVIRMERAWTLARMLARRRRRRRRRW